MGVGRWQHLLSFRSHWDTATEQWEPLLSDRTFDSLPTFLFCFVSSCSMASPGYSISLSYGCLSGGGPLGPVSQSGWKTSQSFFSSLPQAGSLHADSSSVMYPGMKRKRDFSVWMLSGSQNVLRRLKEEAWYLKSTAGCPVVQPWGEDS